MSRVINCKQLIALWNWLFRKRGRISWSTGPVNIWDIHKDNAGHTPATDDLNVLERSLGKMMVLFSICASLRPIYRCSWTWDRVTMEVENYLSSKCVVYTWFTRHPSLAAQHTVACRLFPLVIEWLGAGLVAATQHQEKLLYHMTVAREKIRIQNVKYDFCWMHITFTSSWSQKL